jgi:cobalt-zinc-cadmium efflux system outer membrane protein
VAARALLAYFNSIAATEDVRVTEHLTALADALKQVATERAKAGVGSDLDASLADAAAVRIEQVQAAAQERLTISTAELTSLLGVANAQELRFEGELAPLAAVDTSRGALLDAAFARRTELSIVMAERQLYSSRVDLYQRLRIPNPTVSLFARKDWIGEQAIGIGLGFPIPLPAPLGTNYAGEIAEAVAMAERAGAEADATRRAIAIEVITALAHVDASRRRAQLYTPERLHKTRHALMTIAEELAAGRLPPREALMSQQGLTDVLLGDVEARRSLCLATVALATATGFPFEREAL